jgi:tetratricopeptide (TPR) repeat protein
MTFLSLLHNFSNPEKHLLYRPGLILILSLSAACTTITEKSREQVAPVTVEDETADIRIVRIEPVRPKIELTEDILYQLLLAEIAGHRGHIDVSVENYLELASTTRDPKIVERATQIAVYARNTEAATASARLWVELDPQNPDAHQVLAVMSLRQGDVEATLDHLQQILEYSHGDLNRKLWMIANMLGREQDKQLVMTVMERMLEGRQDNPQAVFAFANIAARMGEAERSIELLEQALKLDPDNDNAAMSYITLLQRMDRANDAITWLETNLAGRESNDFNLRLAYARLLTDVQRYDQARRQFEILSVSAPNNADVLYALGLLYLQDNRLEDSEMYFKRLVERSDRFNNAKYYLGRIAEERKDLETASTWYQTVAGDENLFDAQVRLGLIKAQSGDIEGALQHLKGIQAASPPQQTLLIQAEGEILSAEKRYAEALAVYDNALSNGSYNPDLLYSRAMVAEKLDRIDLLERDLREILSKDPDNVQALNALGYTLADRTERIEEAYDLIKQAHNLSPNDFFIIDSMGWVLYRLGQHEEALNYLRQAMSLREDPEIAAHLFEVLWIMGREEEANKLWETARKSNPDNNLLLNVKQRFDP